MIGLPAPWGQVLIAVLIGTIPGLLFLEWLASPFGPGIPKLNPILARLLLTLGQYVRGRGVLVKRAEGHYDIGTWLSETNEVLLEDGDRLEIDPDNLRWGLFGKKPFAVTWEPGTDLHEAATQGGELTADGGEYEINMAAVHRRLEGANEIESIDRTEEHAKAEYTATDGLSDRMLAVAVILMLILGATFGMFIV